MSQMSYERLKQVATRHRFCDDSKTLAQKPSTYVIGGCVALGCFMAYKYATSTDERPFKLKMASKMINFEFWWNVTGKMNENGEIEANCDNNEKMVEETRQVMKKPPQSVANKSKKTNNNNNNNNNNIATCDLNHDLLGTNNDEKNEMYQNSDNLRCKYCNLRLFRALSFYRCNECKIYVCKECALLSNDTKYNYSIACQLYKHIINHETETFLEQLAHYYEQFSMYLYYRLKHIEAPSIESDNQRKQRRRILFAVILNEWFEKNTSKTLLMAAIAEDNESICKAIVKKEVIHTFCCRVFCFKSLFCLFGYFRVCCELALFSFCFCLR